MRKSLILRSAILLTTIFVGLLALDPGQVTYATLADGLGYSASVVNSPPSADAGKSQTVRRDERYNSTAHNRATLKEVRLPFAGHSYCDQLTVALDLMILVPHAQLFLLTESASIW